MIFMYLTAHNHSSSVISSRVNNNVLCQLNVAL